MICEISFQKALKDTDQESLNSEFLLLNIRLKVVSVLEAGASFFPQCHLLASLLGFFVDIQK